MLSQTRDVFPPCAPRRSGLGALGWSHSPLRGWAKHKGRTAGSPAPDWGQFSLLCFPALSVSCLFSPLFLVISPLDYLFYFPCPCSCCLFSPNSTHIIPVSFLLCSPICRIPAWGLPALCPDPAAAPRVAPLEGRRWVRLWQELKGQPCTGDSL